MPILRIEAKGKKNSLNPKIDEPVQTCNAPSQLNSGLSKTIEMKRKLHSLVMSRLDVKENCLETRDIELLKARAEKEISALMSDMLIPPELSDQVRRELISEIFELGPLARLLEDDSISEIMVNGANQTYVERNGKIEKTDVIFISQGTLLAIIQRIVSAVNRRIDESSPFVDARLPDGSRVNAIIPPASLNGPCLSIRKFRKKHITPQELIEYGSITEEALSFLKRAVERKANIIVGGGTGTGKTTFLNTLSSFIPDEERIITIEDSAELKIQKPHVISLESRPPNIEGKGEITIRDLVRNSLRMRPDRIIVGECRGGEALDMLQAMNTGHEGSMTTAHANSPRDLLSRLETMVLFSGIDLPVRAIREQIAAAIDIIVFLSRERSGKRVVTHITEIIGMNDMTILHQDIFIRETSSGTLERTGVRSKYDIAR